MTTITRSAGFACRPPACEGRRLNLFSNTPLGALATDSLLPAHRTRRRPALVLLQAAVIARLVVDEGASILVSGSAKQMPRDVREAFRDALARHEQVVVVVVLVLAAAIGRFQMSST